MRESVAGGLKSAKLWSPITAWGLFGGLIVLFQSYIYVAWINSDYFTPLTAGTDPTPTAVLEAVRNGQVQATITAITVVLLTVIYSFVRRRLAAVALIGIAWLLCCWQDPLSSYFRPFLAYGGSLLNYGTWAPFIPGYALPNGELLPQPLLLLFPGYISMPAFAMVGVLVCRGAMKLWPNLGPAALYVVASIAIASVDLVIETSKVKEGLFAFPAVFAPFSFDVGEVYQYPIYSSVVFGMAIAVSSLLLLYVDGQGRTPVEAGADDIANPLARTTMRILALAGVVNAALLVYMAVMVWLSLLSSPIPHYPTYLLNSAFCEADVPYACR